MRRGLLLGVVGLVLICLPSLASGRVLRVGTYHGVKGQYKTIQSAINAAKPGDWILIAPGDYKTHGSEIPSNSHGEFPAGILITKPHLYIRGMNRNTVIVDGTKAGAPCNDAKKDQNFGPKAKGGPAGLNGIMVWKADDVWVQNLTSCNFLGGSGGDGGTGNEIWWNGGADSGGAKKVSIGGYGYLGSYLNATSTWYDPDTSQSQEQREVSAAEYGIFSSNWSGGKWYESYASNMNDSGYYIGACGQQCGQTVDKAWAEYNALGYSGSNSGGKLVIENSQFDNNEDGFDTNSQNGDNPPPQIGLCPGNGTDKLLKGVAGADIHSCWVFMHNYVHDNNNPNVPAAGSAAAGPVGTGMSISGGRYDTVYDNRFENNGAWGNILVPYPDMGGPCTGGTRNYPLLGPGSCLYDEWGDAVLDNKYKHDGFFGNATNGDFEFLNFQNNEPTDCFHSNTELGGGSIGSTDAKFEKTYPVCNNKKVDANPNGVFLQQVLCDSQVQIDGTDSCTSADHYPRLNPKKLKNGLHPLPPAKALPTMPNPCQGVPKNPWCSASHHKAKHSTFTG